MKTLNDQVMQRAYLLRKDPLKFSGRYLAKNSQTAQTLFTTQIKHYACFVYDAMLAKLQPLASIHVTFTFFFQKWYPI